jgi:hypothetical protein
MQVKRAQVGWGFWLQYVLASTFGMLVGFFMGFLSTDIVPKVLGEWVGASVFGIVLGIAVGILQWIVLRRRVSGAGLWVFAPVAGGVGIFYAAALFGFSTSYESLAALFGWIAIVALAGLVTGILQWAVLKRRVSRAGWWVPVSTAGWVLSVMGVRALPWGVDDLDALWGMVTTGLVLGVVTGGVLVWLLRHTPQEV